MNKKPNAGTLSMVAGTAGVDLSTVSRVVNSTDEDAGRWASAATIERIR